MTHQESVVSEIFKKRFTVFLIFSVIAASTLCVQPMYAQSSVGVGLVALSGSNGSGLSVRFKNFQVMGGGKFSSSPDPMRGVRLEQLGVAIRYNHSLHEWKRIRFKVFGQLGGYKNSMQDPESSSSIRYHFTGGGSAELRTGRKSSSKGLSLTLDIGLSIDDAGSFGTVPARGVGLHIFF